MVSAGTALRIDGTAMPSARTVAELAAVCDRAEDGAATGVVTVEVSGSPAPDWTDGFDVTAVTRWERAVRRLERLPVVTVAVASGDCGGAALDVLMATDLRIATTGTRLMVPTDGEATWPGMALYRLAQQTGASRIRRAVLFGRPIDAAEAVALSIVDELADDAATATAADLVRGFSGREVAIRRQLMFDAAGMSFEDAIGPHLAACDRALRRARTPEAS
jgi:isomerase DpgB